MRAATNQRGINLKRLIAGQGWQPVGAPHETRELADAALVAFKAEAPETEWRVYPALEGQT